MKSNKISFVVIFFLFIILFSSTCFGDRFIYGFRYEPSSQLEMNYSGNDPLIGVFEETDKYDVASALGFGAEIELKKSEGRFSFGFGFDYFFTRNLPKANYSGISSGYGDYSGSIDIIDANYQMSQLYGKVRFYLGKNFFF